MKMVEDYLEIIEIAKYSMGENMKIMILIIIKEFFQIILIIMNIGHYSEILIILLIMQVYLKALIIIMKDCFS